MTKNNWSNILSVLARTALASVFVFGQMTWAIQAQNAKDKPTSNAVARPPQTPPNSSTAGSKAQPAGEQTATAQNSSAEENSHRGGQREGISVHGHWSIEVHNPDGSLVRHVEFENSLDPGFSFSFQGQTLTLPGGAAYLAALLAGQAATPTWEIDLVGPAGLSNTTNTTNAPCVPSAGGITFNRCSIFSPTPSGCPFTILAGQSCNLSVSTLGTAPALTAIQLTGSVVATQNGQISTVATGVSQTCPAAITNCALSSTHGVDSFTSSSNFPGAPIAVSPGQTIAVTVVISFS